MVEKNDYFKIKFMGFKTVSMLFSHDLQRFGGKRTIFASFGIFSARHWSVPVDLQNQWNDMFLNDGERKPFGPRNHLHQEPPTAGLSYFFLLFLFKQRHDLQALLHTAML